MKYSEEELFKKVCSAVVKVMNVSEGSLNIDTHFTKDLGADSLDKVTLLMAFEDEFKKQIPDDDAQKLSTIRETVEYIQKLSDEHVVSGE